MLGDGGERDAERFRQTRYGHRAAGEMVEDRAARGIPECVEQAIDLMRLGHVGFVSRRSVSWSLGPWTFGASSLRMTVTFCCECEGQGLAC